MGSESTKAAPSSALRLRVAAWIRAGEAPRPLPTLAFGWVGGIASVAFLLLAVAVASGSTLAFDTRAELAVYRHATALLDVVMRALTSLGSAPVITALVLAIGLLLVKARRRIDAVVLVATIAGQSLLNVLLKFAVHRPRPQLFDHGSILGFSFPSGHAMTSLCLASVLLFLVWPRLSLPIRGMFMLVAVALVLGIGMSRVYLGVHYPSDVVGGWLAATAWLAATSWMIRRIAAREAELARVMTTELPRPRGRPSEPFA